LSHSGRVGTQSNLEGLEGIATGTVNEASERATRGADAVEPPGVHEG
jgi:hypothetical protein